MVFKFLFKPKGKIEIQAQDNSLPGAQLPLEIRVTTEEKVEPREIRAELVGEETYYLRARGKLHHSKLNYTFARIIQKVAEHPALLQQSEQKWGSSIQIPADTLPTCCGKWVNIRWKLKAVLDVPNRADLSHGKPFHISCLPPQSSDMPVLPAEKIFGQVTLMLKAPRAISAGNTLKGQLVLQIKDNLSISGIRVELVRVEKAGSRDADEVISIAQVSGEASFNQNGSPSFAFSLDMPADAPPTAIGMFSSLRWKVRAVIDRNMKTDFNVEQELLVYNTSKPAKG
jgi:hypothetical protein